MLSKLATGRPTVIAGDVNTFELVMRHWMQTSGKHYNSSLARSPAAKTRHGDFTIAANVFMRSREHRVGRSFDEANALAIDSVSDAHDMVCVVLTTIDSQGTSVAPSSPIDLVTADAVKLGCHAESTALPSDLPVTIDAAELGSHSGTFGAADPVGDLHLEPAECSRLRDSAALAVTHAQNRLLQAAEHADVHSDSPHPPSTPAESGERSPSPSRWDPSMSPSDFPGTTDAAELGCHSGTFDAAGPLQAAEDSDVHSDSPDPPSKPAQSGERSRSPSRFAPSTSPPVWDRSPSPASLRSPSPERTPLLVGGHELPVEFLAAMQDMLWPATFQERDRPADLLSFESSLGATVRVASFEESVSVAALILKLRQVALDRRASEAQANRTFQCCRILTAL